MHIFSAALLDNSWDDGNRLHLREMTVPFKSPTSDSPRIFVLGAVRNGAKTLKSAVRDIERFVGSEEVSRWFIVESDSVDKTLATLSEIAAEKKGFSFESLGALSNTEPSRIRRITIARQRALESASKFIKDDDLVIVADMDGVTSSLPVGGLLTVKDRLGSFDVITASSKPRYYDILALRSEGWVDEDYRVTRRRLLEKGASPFESHFESVIKKQRKISHSEEPIPVQSAFGGVAIYSGRAFLSGKYEFNDKDECEHVGFHRHLTEKGFRICIDPRFAVTPEWRHTALSSPLLSLPWKLAIKLGALLPKALVAIVTKRFF